MLWISFSCPGTSTIAQHRSVGQRRVGVTEVERDAARLFFRQAVGIDAGQRLHQRGLAVVDVTRGANNHLPTIMV
jgi:hypothetical protein